MACKAEHVVDLDSDLILAAEIRPANHADAHTLADSLLAAQANLEAAGVEQRIEEVVADKGDQAADTLELCDAFNLRTYIPEPKRKGQRDWSKLTDAQQRVVLENRERRPSAEGPGSSAGEIVSLLSGTGLLALSTWLKCSFAHLCESGGMRRTWLRGLVDVTKRSLVAVAGHNLSRILRKLFGIGKPRTLQGRRTGAGTGLDGLEMAFQRLGNACRTLGGVISASDSVRERFPRDESTILALAT